MSGNWVPLDDLSEQLLVNGSGRQWEGAVHSTSEVGASCSLWFKGIAIGVRGTIPAGNDEQAFDYSIDDQPHVRISHKQGSSNNYSVEFLRVMDLKEDVHRLTLINSGAAPFQVDFFEYWPGTSDPIPDPIFPSTMSQTRPSETSGPSNQSPNDNIGQKRALSSGAIAGIVVGATAIVLICGVLLLRRYRKKRQNSSLNLLGVSPFDSTNLAPQSSTAKSNGQSSAPEWNPPVPELPPGYVESLEADQRNP